MERDLSSIPSAALVEELQRRSGRFPPAITRLPARRDVADLTTRQVVVPRPVVQLPLTPRPDVLYLARMEDTERMETPKPSSSERTDYWPAVALLLVIVALILVLAVLIWFRMPPG